MKSESTLRKWVIAVLAIAVLLALTHLLGPKISAGLRALHGG